MKRVEVTSSTRSSPSRTSASSAGRNRTFFRRAPPPLASSSTTSFPMLWRVRSYRSPGLPRPATSQAIAGSYSPPSPSAGASSEGPSPSATSAASSSSAGASGASSPGSVRSASTRSAAGGITEMTGVSAGVRKVTPFGTAMSPTRSMSPISIEETSAGITSGRSFGRHSISISRRWCSITPPALIPGASPTSCTSTASVIRSSRRTARKSMWMKRPWMWSRWISRGIARCVWPSTFRSTNLPPPPAVWNRCRRSLPEMLSFTGSMPWPYRMPGTRPLARRRRAAPLPVSARSSAVRVVSMLVRTSRDRRERDDGSGRRLGSPRRRLDLVRAAEDLRDRGVFEHGAERAGDQRSDRKHAQLRELLLLGDRDRVGHDHLVDRRLLEVLSRLPREQRVRRAGEARPGPHRGERLHALGQGRGRVDHVVDEHARAAVDLADHRHLLDLVRLGPRTPLVQEREVGVQVLAELLGGLDPAGVGSDDHDVVAVQPERVLQVAGQQRERREVVERSVEEPLDLPAVQVDRHDAVRPGGAEQVRDELRADRLAGHGLLVLTGVAVVRHHRGDPLGARALHGVDHDQLFDDRLVHGLVMGLHDEHVGAAYRLLGTEVDLARREASDLPLTDRDAEVVGDLARERRMDGARVEHHPLLGHDLHAQRLLVFLVPWRRCSASLRSR